MNDEEWSELQAKLMAQSVTTHRRNGNSSVQPSRWTRPAVDYGRRRLVRVLMIWALGLVAGIGITIIVQAVGR